MDLQPTWRFRRMGRDEPGIDPVQDETRNHEHIL